MFTQTQFIAMKESGMKGEFYPGTPDTWEELTAPPAIKAPTLTRAEKRKRDLYALNDELTRRLQICMNAQDAIELHSVRLANQYARQVEARAQVETKLNDALALIESQRDTIEILRHQLAEDTCTNRTTLAGELAVANANLKAVSSAGQQLRNAFPTLYTHQPLIKGIVDKWDAIQRHPLQAVAMPCNLQASQLQDCPHMLPKPGFPADNLECKVCGRSCFWSNDSGT